mmetsp:Transcript_34169/g.81991  ORF Transcript_34169/g.81991 Transcript_34169/m.81991 type:complete len:358 (-) Transcript_34169:1004-2077(-)
MQLPHGVVAVGAAHLQKPAVECHGAAALVLRPALRLPVLNPSLLQLFGPSDLHPNLPAQVGWHPAAHQLIHLIEHLGVQPVRVGPVPAPGAQRLPLHRLVIDLGAHTVQLDAEVAPRRSLLPLIAVQVRHALEHLLHVVQLGIIEPLRSSPPVLVEVGVIAPHPSLHIVDGVVHGGALQRLLQLKGLPASHRPREATDVCRLHRRPPDGHDVQLPVGLWIQLGGGRLDRREWKPQVVEQLLGIAEVESRSATQEFRLERCSKYCHPDHPQLLILAGRQLDLQVQVLHGRLLQQGALEDPTIGALELFLLAPLGVVPCEGWGTLDLGALVDEISCLAILLDVLQLETGLNLEVQLKAL